MRRILWGLTLLTVFLAAGTASSFEFTELENSVTEAKLENGLTVLVMERHEAPVASFITLADVGGVDDPKEYTGMAHMFEHMAFKGTTTLGTKDLQAELEAMRKEDSIWTLLRAERKKGREADSARLAELEEAFNKAIEEANEYVVPGAFSQVLESEGATSLNAGTSKDYTMYMMSLPSNKVELWMAMESERFLNPVLREMYRERNVITEERRQVLENNPIMRTIDAMQAAAYKAHPYGVSIIGHMSDIKNYTRDAAREYYEKYYVPSNMVIAIVGDVDADEVIELAREYWGRIPARPEPEPVATIEPPQKGERRVLLEDPAQPFAVIGWHIPDGTHPDWPAVQALSDYLGQGRTSLLYESLKKEKKIASEVGIYPGWPGNKYPSLLMCYVMPSAEHTAEECEKAVLEEIEKLKEEPIPAEEAEKIKARAKAGMINQLNNNMGLAMGLASYQNDWGDWREMFRELDRINAVTAEDIQRVAKEYLTDNNRTVALLQTVES
jgi:predicted Zn-dependent peptidase